MVTASSIKAIFPEFDSLTDATIDVYIAQAQRCVSETAWGSRYDDGVTYLTAHLLAMFALDSTTSGASGAVKRKKAGVNDLEVEYAVSDSGESDSLMSTKYGRHYVSLRKKILGIMCLS